jgi:hypothetical protein
MPRLPFEKRNLLTLISAACLGGFIGFIVSLFLDPGVLSSRKEKVHVLPMPHLFPKYPGGITLRFAMVHDVLHERYARHGRDYYIERNRRARESLKTLSDESPDTEKAFALMDDLGVGLDSVTEHDQAVAVMRDKLQRQLAMKLSGRALYTTYANLGTFLIHGNMAKAGQGDVQAKERLREGLGFIKKSIEVNPEAHFGREVWQAVIAEFMLTAMEKPELLLRYDMIGDALGKQIDPVKSRAYLETWSFFGRDAPRPEEATKSDSGYRWQITHAGEEDSWDKDVRSSQPKAKGVPFDEPTLGIVGMWRLGGGANPHFALALGEIMIRVGQRYIAWTAYERAIRLADRFSRDAAIREKFIKHCRARQRLITESLPPDEESTMRNQFDAELQHGINYQKAYQEYEAEQIKAGASIEDPSFYDRFFEGRDPIETPPEGVDWFVGSKSEFAGINPAPILLFAGIFALAAAFWLRFKNAWTG